MDQKQTNKLNINDLMFNIESKLSLLSEIQKSTLQKDDLLRQQKVKQQQQQQSQSEQINLPMQMLNKKMLQIINQKSPSSTKQNNKNDNKTFEKKRLQLNQPQTATRNIDEIKRNILPKDIYNIQHNKPTQHHSGQQVRQFNTNQTQHSMSQSMLNSSSKSSSRIINKFNQIQINYMQKIKSLTFKVSFLQQKLSQNQQEKKQLMESLETYKILYSRKQQEIDKEIQSKLQDIKEKLIEKFAQQCRLKYNQYITQLKDSTSLLNQQRKKRKFYEEQNKVFKLEKQNYQQMYKSLAKKQKQQLKLDIDKTRNQLLSQSQNLSGKSYHNEQTYLMMDNRHQNQDETQFSQIQKINQEDSDNMDKENVIYNTRENYHQLDFSKVKNKFSIEKSNKEKSLSKSKDKSNSKKDKSLSVNKKSHSSHQKASKSRIQTEHQLLKSSGIKKTKINTKKSTKQMTKQQLIPFLAKGIQQLKQRLKMK